MKKKAFTLTELLIVVVIIGTLAAVVLPKFTKIVENHRTMEAENIMRAVRSEQEARCTLDRNYTANSADLSSWPSDLGNNYTYAFDATGMRASSRNKGYTLRMMSYADGGICCEGDDCVDVGKYPSCTGFEYKANTACAAPIACQLKDEIQECGAGYTGIKGRRVTAACTYEEIDTCEPVPVPPTCDKENYEKTCQEAGYAEGYTGKVVYTVNADCEYNVNDTCKAQEQPQPTCDKEGYEKTCQEAGYPEGYTGKVVGTVTEDCEYQVVDTCKKPQNACQPSNGDSYTELCVEDRPQVGSIYYTWNGNTCGYDRDDSRCKDCTKPTHNGENVYFLSDCPSPQVGSGTVYTWDESLCDYKKEGPYCGNGNNNGNSGKRKWTEHAYGSNSWQNNFYIGGDGYGVCSSALYQMENGLTLSNGGGLSPQKLCIQKGYVAGEECNNSGGDICIQSYEMNCRGNTVTMNCNDTYSWGISTPGQWYCFGKMLTYLSCD